MVITLEKEKQAKACGRENKEGWWDRFVQSDEPKDTLYCDREPFMLGDMDDLKHEVRAARRRSRTSSSVVRTGVVVIGVMGGIGGHHVHTKGRQAPASAARSLLLQPPHSCPSPQNMRYHISKMLGTDDPGGDRGGASDF